MLKNLLTTYDLESAEKEYAFPFIAVGGLQTNLTISAKVASAM